MCKSATDPRAVHSWQSRTNPAEIAHKPNPQNPASHLKMLAHNFPFEYGPNAAQLF